MITITQFSISNDLLTMQLDFNVTVGETATSLKFWDEKTFKDTNQEIDLTAKLAGANETESVTIVPGDVGISTFSGMYFLEITSSEAGTNPAMVSAISLRQYYSTVSALLFTVNTSCLNCNNNLQNALVLDMYLEAIKTSLQLGRFRDAIYHLSKINIVTTSVDCDTCFNQPVEDPGDGWVSVGVLDCVLGTDPLV